MSALSKEDVARLHTYLVVPVAVSDAIACAAPLEGDVQYGLHVALSEIDPDSALLAIALSSHRVAVEFVGQIPVASALKMEAARIIEDYAPDWLGNYHDNTHPVAGAELMNLLSHVPDDLESLADLLDSLQASIRDTLDPCHALCAVLSVQARAHMEIAAYVLEELESEQQGWNDGDVCTFEAATLYSDYQASDNIILFPVARRR